MSRYVLYYRGKSAPPKNDLELIKSVPGIAIIEKHADSLMLVEADEQAVESLLRCIPPGWIISPETIKRLA
jgi:hypothetical protein